MSLIHSSTIDSAAVHHLRLVSSSAASAAISSSSTKRKLDDCSGEFVDRMMKRHEPDFSAAVSAAAATVDSKAENGSCAFLGGAADVSLESRSSSFCSCSSGEPSSSSSSNRIQFFIRLISEGKTMVVHADKDDTVLSLHERIHTTMGIPVIEQRLIYRGKQLQWEQSLAECGIENDSNLNMVGRMRSTEHPQAWQVIDDMLSVVVRMCRGEAQAVDSCPNYIKNQLNVFLAMTPRDDNDLAVGHLQIFMATSVPAALVMLYVSSNKGNKECADVAVRHFLNSCRNTLPKSLQSLCAPLVLEFCKLLRSVAHDGSLYISCRSTLGYLLESVGLSRGSKTAGEAKGLIMMQEIFPFVGELADNLSKDLVTNIDSVMSLGPLSTDVRDFSALLLPLRTAILDHIGLLRPITLPLRQRGHDRSIFGKEIEYLHGIFKDLLDTMNKCLTRIESWLGEKGSEDSDNMPAGCSQYLAILKELNGIAKLYQGAEEQLLSVLRHSKNALCALIIGFARRIDDHQWILEYKDVTNFEARRHLLMMLFPDVKDDYEEMHEMLIDRSNLLSESFEYIGRADADSLHGGLFMEFKNEEATGPGVLREWFYLVCQAIFDPQNALFVPCPMDHRRFYPNPASKVDPMHLEYFTFSGRVVALALMHKIQVGVLLDRVFFLQLTGVQITLEDIKDADPCLYSSCKQILEMDPEFIDSDALGLTFVREIEELGYRKVVELCPGGKSISVNSRNRDEYVNLLIQHRFVTSISQQVSYFARGFADVLSNSKLQRFFFQSLEAEDLDKMLYGTENAVNIEDWKAHTEYNGYKETDLQIVWFWKIVRRMSAEQRKVLLFFWTSLKHLPFEGFCGLASRLQIYKSYEPQSRLPSSHTCFYRLCLPQYPSMAIMQERLNVITQEHVGCSFGTW